MTKTVKARFANGVFTPLETIDLPKARWFHWTSEKSPPQNQLLSPASLNLRLFPAATASSAGTSRSITTA